MKESLFDYHPDSQEIIEKYYSLLMSEADRGAILLGVSIIDEQLTELFKRTAPTGLSKTQTDKLFDSRGPFGELSSKLDIAFVCLRDPHKLLPHIIHTLSDRPVSSTTELSTAKFALALADNIAYLY